MKLLWLVYCRGRWQAFSLDHFIYAYNPENPMYIAGIRSDNILFLDVIHDTEIFEQADKWRQHEMHDLEYKLFYHQPKNRHVCDVK